MVGCTAYCTRVMYICIRTRAPGPSKIFFQPSRAVCVLGANLDYDLRNRTYYHGRDKALLQIERPRSRAS